MFEALLFSDFKGDLEEEVEEIRQVAGQVAAHKPEFPLLSHSSARVGSGNEADGNVNAEGEASHQLQAWYIVLCCLSAPKLRQHRMINKPEAMTHHVS